MVSVYAPEDKQKARVSFFSGVSHAGDYLPQHTRMRFGKAFICFLKERDKTQVEM